ncbi:MAG: PQQ-dependent sugar dehydrogenase [Cyanosarcina radialis HA8281-LM2]|nr:PQQ-dependent sugar dehydrogenase [Cyanosarcina radialis HA8281-LM2]
MNIRAFSSIALSIVSLAATVAPASAAVPPGFKATPIARNIIKPTTMAIGPDGRIFVAEQEGRIRIVKSNSLLSAPFLDIRSKVDSNGERGLLGIAIDPNFAQNKWIYVYYTAKTPNIHNRVSRFTANGDLVVPGSEKVLLDIQPLSSLTNHNGGAIHFWKDGTLLIAVGDNANPNNAQTLANMKGKLLRLNKDGTIPTDNPFYRTASGANRSIWALGLRNPYSFGVQRGTGRTYINDVGQDSWEEINQNIKAANYGWPRYEGPETDSRYVSPIFAYQHGSGNGKGCSIVGGAFYNPVTVKFPFSYVGDYFFGDFCNGWIRSYDSATKQTTLFASGLNFLVDVKVASDGKLYYLERGGGVLTQVIYSP